MRDIVEGDVVIVSTNQAGTYIGQVGQVDHQVLLANGCIWMGKHHEMRLPQTLDELNGVDVEVDRFKDR
jgi:hypothetical protein